MLPCMRRASPVLLCALALAVSARADEHVVPHEYVPHLGSDEGALVVSQGHAEPDAIVAGGEVVTPPAGGSLRPEERPMTSDPGAGRRHDDPGRRSPTFRPDRITELESTLSYYEVFTPAIAPYKRVSALDGVALADDGRTPVLVVAHPTPRSRVPAEGTGATPPDERARDQFWGSVVLEMAGGTEVPMPSVAPDSRLLTLRTEPTTLLHVEKDGADNWVAVAALPVRGEVRVTFLTDAPRDYFARALPDAPVTARVAEVAPLPASVQRRAETFAAELGLSRHSSYREAVETLVRWFRSFEESETPPADTGDTFLDLARGKKGVCRHRAYAFTITALALGIPTRFVQNEAHAWVEVAIPGPAGWMRIDLGGAANGLEAHNASDAPLYHSATPDTLPRPDSYQRSYTQGHDVQGLRAGDTSTGTGGLASGNGGGGGGASDLPARPDGARPTQPSPGNEPPAQVVPASTRVPLAVAVNTFYSEVFRGRELQVTGRVTDATSGAGLAGQRVEVSLAAPRGNRGLLLGVTVSRDGGDFRASFGVPPDVPVGEYRLTVIAPGDATHLAGTAR